MAKLINPSIDGKLGGDPDLVESAVIDKVNNLLKKSEKKSFVGNIFDVMKNIYTEFIKPHLFAVICLIILGIVLYYRYQHVKKEKIKKKYSTKKKNITLRIISLFKKQHKELIKLRKAHIKLVNKIDQSAKFDKMKEKEDNYIPQYERDYEPNFSYPTRLNDRTQYYDNQERNMDYDYDNQDRYNGRDYDESN